MLSDAKRIERNKKEVEWRRLLKENNPEEYRRRLEYMKQWDKAHPHRRRGRTTNNDWQKRNPEKVKEKVKEKYERYRRIKQAVKLFYGCQNPACLARTLPACCLDFHHIDKVTKKYNIGAGSGHISSMEDEINKCTVICSNCHRLATWEELDISEFRRCCILLQKDGTVLYAAFI